MAKAKGGKRKKTSGGKVIPKKRQKRKLTKDQINQLNKLKKKWGVTGDALRALTANLGENKFHKGFAGMCQKVFYVAHREMSWTEIDGSEKCECDCCQLTHSSQNRYQFEDQTILCKKCKTRLKFKAMPTTSSPRAKPSELTVDAESLKDLKPVSVSDSAHKADSSHDAPKALSLIIAPGDDAPKADSTEPHSETPIPEPSPPSPPKSRNPYDAVLPSEPSPGVKDDQDWFMDQDPAPKPDPVSAEEKAMDPPRQTMDQPPELELAPAPALEAMEEDPKDLPELEPVPALEPVPSAPEETSSYSNVPAVTDETSSYSNVPAVTDEAEELNTSGFSNVPAVQQYNTNIAAASESAKTDELEEKTPVAVLIEAPERAPERNVCPPGEEIILPPVEPFGKYARKPKNDRPIWLEETLEQQPEPEAEPEENAVPPEDGFLLPVVP